MGFLVSGLGSTACGFSLSHLRARSNSHPLGEHLSSKRELMDRSRWTFRLYQVRVFLPCVHNCRADVEHDPPTIASFAESISPAGVNFRDYRSLTGMGLMNTKYARSHSRFRISKEKHHIVLCVCPIGALHYSTWLDQSSPSLA